MANTNLITVGQLMQELEKALTKLAAFDPETPINLAVNDEDGGQTQHGFLTHFEIDMHLFDDDDEQKDLNVDINYKEAK